MDVCRFIWGCGPLPPGIICLLGSHEQVSRHYKELSVTLDAVRHMCQANLVCIGFVSGNMFLETSVLFCILMKNMQHIMVLNTFLGWGRCLLSIGSVTDKCLIISILGKGTEVCMLANIGSKDPNSDEKLIRFKYMYLAPPSV